MHGMISTWLFMLSLSLAWSQLALRYSSLRMNLAYFDMSKHVFSKLVKL